MIKYLQSKLLEIDTAIEAGSLRDVKNLLNRKELVVARDNLGLTTLHKAVLYGQKDICEYLMSVNPKSIFAKDHVSQINAFMILNNNSAVLNPLDFQIGQMSNDC